jgi:hypothetical protein
MYNPMDVLQLPPSPREALLLSCHFFSFPVLLVRSEDFPFIRSFCNFIVLTPIFKRVGRCKGWDWVEVQ